MASQKTSVPHLAWRLLRPQGHDLGEKNNSNSVWELIQFRTYILVFARHSGHGPGWHSSLHLCSQFFLFLPQTSAQECGVSLRFHSGSRTRPQKQRYSRGDRCIMWLQPAGQRMPPSLSA